MDKEKIGVAGTLESSDILVTVNTADAKGIEIQLESPVAKQFGASIEHTIRNVMEELQIPNAKIRAVDKGALDCTIRARVLAAACKAEGRTYSFGGK